MFGMIFAGEVPPMQRDRSTIPPELESLRAKLLQPKAADRIQTAREAFRVLTRSEAWAPDESGAGHGDAEAVRSPFPAVVTETPVATGDRVATGDVVVVIEAMKMLHALTARGPGLVARVHVAVGESVEADRVLVSFEAPGEDAPRRQED